VLADRQFADVVLEQGIQSALALLDAEGPRVDLSQTMVVRS
jgi:hypothetical protein